MAHETPGKLIAITAVMMALPVIFVVLRVLSRRKRGVQLGADDYTVLVSFVLHPARMGVDSYARLTLLRRSSCSPWVLSLSTVSRMLWIGIDRTSWLTRIQATIAGELGTITPDQIVNGQIVADAASVKYAKVRRPPLHDQLR